MGEINQDAPEASDAVQILYTNWRGETAVRTILLTLPRAVLMFGSDQWHPEPQWMLAALDVEKRAWRNFALSGIRAWGAEAVAAIQQDADAVGAPETTLPGGEVEGLIDEFSHELIQLGSAPFDDSVDMQATHRRVFELRTALLAGIRSSGGENLANILGRDPDGSGSRASIEPAGAVSPASGGVDPSRDSALAAEGAMRSCEAKHGFCVCRSDEGNPSKGRSVRCLTRYDAALAGVRAAFAPGIETEGQNPKGSGAKHESPIAVGEAPSAMLSASPSPDATSGGEALGRETFATIAQWCEETFGPATAERIASRAAEEMDELLADPHKVEEAADIVIILSRHPTLWAEVERKMAVNRKRQWRLMGDGSGYHIKPAAPHPSQEKGEADA